MLLGFDNFLLCSIAFKCGQKANHHWQHIRNGDTLIELLPLPISHSICIILLKIDISYHPTHFQWETKIVYMYITKFNIDRFLRFLFWETDKVLVDVCHLWSRISPIVAGISEIWFSKLYGDGKKSLHLQTIFAIHQRRHLHSESQVSKRWYSKKGIHDWI